MKSKNIVNLLASLKFLSFITKIIEDLDDSLNNFYPHTHLPSPKTKEGHKILKNIVSDLEKLYEVE